MIECTRCGFKLPSRLSQVESTTIQPAECPTCGARIRPKNGHPKTGLTLIRNYFKDLWQILTQPALFFRHMPIHGGMSRPLVFALVTHWLGAAIGFLWDLLFGGSFYQILHKAYKMSQQSSDFDAPHSFSEWFLGTGQIVADPFFTLFKIGVASLFVFVAARILVSPSTDGHPKEINFESAVKIICFGMTPSIFSVIPLIGGVLSTLGMLVISSIGAKEVYKIDPGKAIVIALFPKLIFVGIIGMGLLFFAFTIMKLLAFSIF